MAQQQQANTPIQVQKYLGGLDYPVGKQDILDRAKEKGAGKDVLAALENLPDQEYKSPIAISREIGQQDD